MKFCSVEYDVIDLFEDDQASQAESGTLKDNLTNSKDTKDVIFAQSIDHLNMAVEGLANLLSYRVKTVYF